MATFTVNTLSDVEDANDGVLSLREAVAASNSAAGADTIRFAQSLNGTFAQTLVLDGSAMMIASGQALTIVGDIDDDGLNDIVVSGGDDYHFNVSSGAKLTLVGLDLINGANQSLSFPSSGALGVDGQAGTEGLGREDFITNLTPEGAQALRLVQLMAGEDGEPGGNGTNGGKGGDGGDGIDVAGSIVNAGELNLVRVGFGSNDAVGTGGGAGARGGQGGFGGSGGEGFGGLTLQSVDGVFVAGAVNGNGVVDAGDGGDGGDGGNGGNGGNGGDGASAAGAILNQPGGIITLTDVSFGGLMPSQIIFAGNSGRGGNGGSPGDAGAGGGAGNARDGGDPGVHEVDSSALGTVAVILGIPGDGGDGGNGGAGGNAGAFGGAGAAAGAILNRGEVTGAAAFQNNEAQSGVQQPSNPFALDIGAGQAGTGGSAGLGGRGNSESFSGQSVPPGEDGFAGVAGTPGTSRKLGASAEAADDILSIDQGSAGVTQGAALVYAHAVQGTAAEGGVLRFNIIRIGAVNGDITANWQVRAAPGSSLSGADFVGGLLPSGSVVLEGEAPGAFINRASVETIEIAVATDQLSEAVEALEFVITGATLGTSSTATLGTAVVRGAIDNSFDDDGTGQTGGNPDGNPTDDNPANDNPANETPADDNTPTPQRDGPTASDDRLFGEGSRDNIRAGAGNDLVNGRGGDDRLAGGTGDDTLIGGSGNDDLAGNNGRDRMLGGLGRDTLKGGGGNDNLIGNAGNDRLVGGGGNDKLNGGGGNDDLIAGGGADRLLGGGGRDNLKGAGSDDFLNGGGGNDRIDGQRGDDVLLGGAGRDTFIFRRGDGSDEIRGFQQGADKIQILNGAGSIDDLEINQDGRNATIEFANVEITVKGARANQFGEEDFDFRKPAGLAKLEIDDMDWSAISVFSEHLL